MGTVDKIHLHYRDRWWPENTEGFAFLYEDEVEYSKGTAEEDWTRYR